MTYPLPPHHSTRRPHVAAEAYHLMLYRSDDGTEAEWIWNSRDGVTPFSITLKSGKSAAHVEWNRDRYAPLHVPEIGSRMFVDLSPARAKATGEKLYDLFTEKDPDFVKENPDRERFALWHGYSSLEAFWPHSPDLIEVTEEIHNEISSRVNRVRLGQMMGLRHG